MKVIIGHYHLNPGGVTKIIQSQIAGLLELDIDIEIALVCDGQGFENVAAPDDIIRYTNQELGYLLQIPREKELRSLVKKIASYFSSLAEKTDIIHFHNIGLGKNVALTVAMYQLAKDGYNIINHAHDFPEDRPVNLQNLKDGIELLGYRNYKEILYPSFGNYRFGVLNTTDKTRLSGCGVSTDRISVWANPVSPPKIKSSTTSKEAKLTLEQDLQLEPGKKIIAYPVRVIRRKNIGEYILLASLFSDVAHWVVTLPPQNPVEVEVYKKWVDFCHGQKISIIFEAGLKTGFETVMKGADVCFTTSIMEGFGMVFVEPWLWGTPVAGREISAVLPDLTQLGIQFPFIYKKMVVEWNNQLIDFPSLNMKDQMDCIKYYFSGRKELFLKQNPKFMSFFKEDLTQNIEKNIEIITNDLSERKYGKQLYQIYSTLSS